VTHRRFFPFRYIPATWCNLVIGLTLKPREKALNAGTTPRSAAA
jgi:hypothetical protein